MWLPSTMAAEAPRTAYEELRQQNMERNESFMRTLGLLPFSSVNEQGNGSFPAQKKAKKAASLTRELRRSQRLAAKPLIPCVGGRSKIVDGTESVTVLEMEGMNEVIGKHDNMHDKGSGEGYSSDNSADSMYAVEFDIEAETEFPVKENGMTTESQELWTPFPMTTMLSREEVGSKVITMESQKLWTGLPVQTMLSREEVGSKVPMMNAVSCQEINNHVAVPNSVSPNTDLAAAFGAHLQGFLMQALLQTTSGLAGPMGCVTSNLQNESTSNQAVSVHGENAQKTWSERTYNIVKARRRRETGMTRTSAGEGSDSQKEFDIPENETPQQRAVRTRRLNRHRKKRATDLTNNRRAFKKRPYVIHVDGMAKARGIHKHVWRAALRGQCGRLDPTMDNINHHPKSVVDSIWHALEKEWEFEGFAHRAREMFERSATKFMRNRKMQLKYKSQKMVDGCKPDDVNGKFWSKIVDLKKVGGKPSTSASCEYSKEEGKRVCQAISENCIRDSVVDHDRQVPKQLTLPSAPKIVESGQENASDKEEDVDEKIMSLQRELERLRKSRQVGFLLDDGYGSGGAKKEGFETGEHIVDSVSKCMKENVEPENVEGPSHEGEGTGKRKLLDSRKQDHCVQGSSGKKSAHTNISGGHSHGPLSECNRESMEMDCGDVVKIYAFSGGRKEEIGKGIVMGLAGTKFAKKDIPKGWRSIKCTSHTESGGLKICPFPSGWTEQLRKKTVKEVNGKCMLWPDMLLRSLMDN